MMPYRVESPIAGERYAVFVPLIVAAVCVTIAVLGWFEAIEDESARREVAATSEAAVAIESAIESRSRAVQRMAQRWGISPSYGREIWRQDAEAFIKDFGGIQAIEWVDADNIVRGIVPLDGNEAARDLQLTFEDKRTAALAQAVSRRSHVLSEPINLVQGGTGVLDFHPVVIDDRHAGFILGVYRYDDLIAQAIVSLGAASDVSVWADGVPVHGAVTEVPTIARSIDLPGTRWQIHARPVGLVRTPSAGMTTMLIVAMIGSGLLGLAMNRAIIARLRSTLLARANESLRESVLELEATQRLHDAARKQMQAICDNTSAVIYAKSLDGTYIMVNQEYASLFGGQPEDYIGKTDHDVFPDEVAASFRRHDVTVVDRGEPIQIEEEAPSAGMTRRYISTKFPLRDADGEIYAVAGISTDITDILDLQRELEHTNAELEQFVYTASHDLKSPIVTILGYTRHLIRDIDAGRTTQLVGYGRHIERAAIKMRENVDDLLQLSRLGRTPSTLMDLDVARVVDDVIESHHAAIQADDTTVNIDVGVSRAYLDPRHLEQILDNLVANALHYGCDSFESRIRICISSPDERSMTIEVEDNGPGVDPRYAEQIFHVFERLSNDNKGTGIGLAIVRRVAELYGGHVSVEQADPTGARFRVVLRGVVRQVAMAPLVGSLATSQ